MCNIAIVNGSPKTRNSVSAMLIGQIEEITKTKATVYQAVKLAEQEDISLTLSDILNVDILLFIFPLYIDSLPAPLVKVLGSIEREAAGKDGRLPVVFAVCSCGFYEAAQTRVALDIIENFAVRAGLKWGYGIGISCGPLVLSQEKNMDKGRAANVYTALTALGEAMWGGDVKRGDEAESQNVFVTPKIPRFFYQLGGDYSWRKAAKKYNTGKLLKAKPYQ